MQTIPWFGYTSRSRNDTFGVEVATMLAAAVKFQIPIPDVLESLQAELQKPNVFTGFLSNIKWNPTFKLPLPRIVRFSGIRRFIMLQLVIKDITAGLPLGQSLERRMARYLPRYYLLAVQKAEAENHIETALPFLAKRLQYQRAVMDDRSPYWPMLVIQLFVILLVFSGLEKFVMPIFSDMAHDFRGTLPPMALILTAVLHFVIKLFFCIGLLVFLFMKTEVLREALLPWIPFAGKEKRRLLVRDLAQSMGVFLPTGEDVLTAARWSLNATTSPWMRKRLARFVESVSNGENWGLAWEKMRLGEYTYPWLIANAAARQDPLGGFESLAEWLHQDINRTTRSIRRWFTPFVIILLGLFVLTIAARLFLIIFNLWKYEFLR